MKNIKIALSILIVIFFLSCKEEVNPPDSPITDNPPELLNFPDCKLVEVDFKASYGAKQLDSLKYEGQRLVERNFYSDSDSKSYSIKRFVYNDEELPTVMLSFNSDTSKTDTLVTYSYENSLLSKYSHHYKQGQNQNKIISSTFYEYENEHLVGISFEGEEGTGSYSITTDKYGNPIRYNLLSLNGQKPEQSVEFVVTYDNKFNPYYKLPDFINAEKYFAQNNLVKFIAVIDGVSEERIFYEYEYYDNGFPSEIVDEFDQGIHTLNLNYECE